MNIDKINQCPCCQNKPIKFWNKVTTGLWKNVHCMNCNCNLKLNKVIGIIIVFFQWISLPLGAFLSTIILEFLPTGLSPTFSLILVIAIPILGIVLMGLFTLLFYYIFDPWVAISPVNKEK